MEAPYRWVMLDNGRSVYRKVTGQAEQARSSLPCPMFRKDTIEPVRSMADGKWYESISSLRRTYRPDGNPQGQEYIELGNEPMRGPPPMKHASKAELSDLLDKVDAMHSRGEIPQSPSI